MTLLAVGVSHKTASVELRGKLAVPAERLGAELGALLADDAVSEAVILSTCNRTEVYASAVTAPDGVRAVVERLRALPGMGPDDAEPLGRALVVKQGPGAVEHLFRVVSSLDSLVLGEAQIIGQVRRAFAAAEEAGAVGEVVRRLFRCALETGKLVRDRTAIGERSVSVSTAAVQLAVRWERSKRGAPSWWVPARWGCSRCRTSPSAGWAASWWRTARSRAPRMPRHAWEGFRRRSTSWRIASPKPT